MIIFFCKLCEVAFILGFSIAVISAEENIGPYSHDMPIAFGFGVDVAILSLAGLVIGLLLKILLVKK